MSGDAQLSRDDLEALSALADGELMPSQVTQACAAWRDEVQARQSWHAYHLIGDVLRSDELARPGQDGAAFMASLREKLAREPVVLAPAPLAVAPQPGQAEQPMVANGARLSRRAWAAPAAVAAGFVAVAGLLVTNLRGPTSPAAPAGLMQLASTHRPADASASAPSVLVVDGALLRDAQLDRYLQAHKEFAGSTALGVAPAGFLRSVTHEVPAR